MNKYEQLEKLAALRAQWILTEDEFLTEKSRLLQSETCANLEQISREWWKLSFEWRVNRFQHFVGTFGWVFVFLFLWALFWDAAESFWMHFIIGIILHLWALVIWMYGLLYVISVKIRRLHDTWRSWIWLLLMFVPFVNIYADIVMFFFAWDKKKNEYWPATSSTEKANELQASVADVDVTFSKIEEQSEGKKTDSIKAEELWFGDKLAMTFAWLFSIGLLISVFIYLISNLGAYSNLRSP